MTPEQIEAAKQRLKAARDGAAAPSSSIKATKERLSAGRAAVEAVKSDLKKPVGIFERLKQGIQGAGEALGRRGENIETAMDLKRQGEAGFGRTTARVAGQMLGGVGDVVGEGLMTSLSVGKKLLTTKDFERDIDEKLAQAGEAVANSPVGQGAADLMKRFEELKVTDPGKAADISAALGLADFATNFLGAGATKAVGKAGIEGAETALKTGARVAADVAEATGTAAGRVGEAVKGGAEVAGDVLTMGKSGLSGMADVAAQIPRRSKAAAEAAQETARVLEAAPPVVREAVTAGFSAPKAAKIATAPAQEKSILRKIKDLADRQAKGQPVKDPAEFAGSFLTKRLSDADAYRKEVGARLGETVKGLKGEMVSSRMKVLKRLQEEVGDGLRIDNKGNLDFSGTTLSSADNAAARNRINALWNDIKGRDAFGLHQLRQEIFETQGGRTLAGVAMSDTEDAAIDALRKGMADAIEEVSDSYKKVNLEYAQIAEPMKKLRRFYKNVEGSTGDIIDERSANLIRRLTSNSPSGQDIKAYVAELDDVMKAAGKAGQVDLELLQDFVNMLSKEYPDLIKATGFEGLVGSGVARGVGGTKFTEMLDTAAGKVIGAATQNTPEFRRKIIDDLLEASAE